MEAICYFCCDFAYDVAGVYVWHAMTTDDSGRAKLHEKGYSSSWNLDRGFGPRYSWPNIIMCNNYRVIIEFQIAAADDCVFHLHYI